MAKFNTEDWGNHFQTKDEVCHYMVSLLDFNNGVVLEPFPGKGNLVKAILSAGHSVINKIEVGKDVDACVMNPPFTPMKLGYEIMYEMINNTDNIVALMPWLTLINGEKRLNKILEYGLCSITHLPRNAFPGSRVQTCILKMKRGYAGKTYFNRFNCIAPNAAGDLE